MMQIQVKNRRTLWTICAVVTGVFSGARGSWSAPETTSQNAAKSPITIVLSAFKVARDKAGRESLVSASSARPGDIIEYRATTTNSSTRTVSNLRVRVPIPAGLAYLPESSQPANPNASADGKTFGSMPLKRVVRDANGAQKIEAVPFAEYRALRWTISKLAPGKSVQVSARARLNAPVLPTVAKKEVKP